MAKKKVFAVKGEKQQVYFGLGLNVKSQSMDSPGQHSKVFLQKKRLEHIWMAKKQKRLRQIFLKLRKRD